MSMDEQRLKDLGAEVIERPSLLPMQPNPDAPVIYTDSVQVRASIHDIMLYLGLADPSNQDDTPVQLVGRIIMSPQHAKALAVILSRHIEVYETAFGTIPTERRMKELIDGASDNGAQEES